MGFRLTPSAALPTVRESFSSCSSSPVHVLVPTMIGVGVGVGKGEGKAWSDEEGEEEEDENYNE